MRSGLPKPDISSGDAVKNAVLATKSVAYSSGPSGYYVAELFKKLGIASITNVPVIWLKPGIINEKGMHVYICIQVY